jgi:hypothetical protein
MGTIAEGLVLRVTAAANSYGCAAAETELLARLIDNFKVALDTNGAVIKESHFCACH